MNIALQHPTMPFQDTSLEELRDLNRFIGDGALRTYQLAILTQGYFTITCPLTGQKTQPHAHYVLPGSGVLYHFNAPQPYVLMAASLKDGFPLLGIITKDEMIWADKPERSDLIPVARKLLAEPPQTHVEPSLRSRITVGDPNFAHFLWNEFPALITALDHTHDFEINLRFDPMGIMHQLARDAGMTICQMSSPTEGKGWSRSPAVMLGSTRCNANAKAAAMNLMGLPPRAPQEPRLWLSIRDQGRTMQNQTAFLTALIKAQSERAPKTEFLIDGFSVPMDAQRQIYAPLRSKFASRIAGAQRIVAALRANTPAAKITDMTGLPLRNALRELATCSFYISHAGTMQHKAAWLYPLPGIQHGNAASLTPAALRWSAHMMDGAIVPIGLPGQLIDDTEICDQPRSTARNLDYRVNDIPAAVQLVLDTLDATPATTGAG